MEQIKIEEFSEKAVIVTGNTYQHKDRIKTALPKSRALWNRKAKGWIFPKKHVEALRVALKDLLDLGASWDDMPGKWNAHDIKPGNGTAESQGFKVEGWINDPGEDQMDRWAENQVGL